MKKNKMFSFQYGTTPLVWASRRGHKEIVHMLLSEHATVDNAGMVSSTSTLHRMYLKLVQWTGFLNLHQFRVCSHLMRVVKVKFKSTSSIKPIFTIGTNKRIAGKM